MPPQIALLVEISRDAGQDPVLSLARALPYDSPEPRWDEPLSIAGKADL